MSPSSAAATQRPPARVAPGVRAPQDSAPPQRTGHSLPHACTRIIRALFRFYKALFPGVLRLFWSTCRDARPGRDCGPKRARGGRAGAGLAYAVAAQLAPVPELLGLLSGAIGLFFRAGAGLALAEAAQLAPVPGGLPWAQHVS